MAIKKQKQRVRNAKVAPTLDALIEKSNGIIITKYGGMTMPQLDKVRHQMRDAKAEFHVTKNTLVARALKAKGYDVPAEWLKGPTAMSFCFGETPVVAKALTEITKDKDFDKFSVVGGVLSGKAIDAKQVKFLAELPPLDTLRANILGLLTASQSGIVGALNAAIGGVAYALQAKVDKEQPAAAE